MARPHAPALPVDRILPAVVADLAAGHDLVLVAPPGSGKTTGLPPALLAAGLCEAGEVLVVEPRRMAARMAAARVAHLLGEEVGDRCGYQVRFDRRVGPDTRVEFVTDGLLLQRLRRDPTLPGVAMVIFDEIHERRLDMDLALALTRRLQQRTRPELRIVAMSATVDPGPLAELLGARVHTCEVRPHPVEVRYAGPPGDVPLARRVTRALHDLIEEDGGRLSGGVLVFLPGAREISAAARACAGLVRSAGAELATLHGDMAPTEQDRVVRPGPAPRVVLSTNVAESSVTLAGVRAVVDGGLARIAQHDPWTGTTRLTVRKVSQASCEQRAGRAGRLGPGRCIRLMSAADFARRPAQHTPEVARLDLARAALDLALLGVDEDEPFPWLEPPPAGALRAARDLLRRLGALTPGGELTAIGRAMASLPLHPRLARVVVSGRELGIGDLAAHVVAAWSEGPLHRDPRSPRRHVLGADVLSDLATLEEPGGDRGLAHRVERVARLLGAPRRGRRRRGSGRGDHRTGHGRARPARDRGERDGRAPPSPEDDAADLALQLAVLAGFPDRVAAVRSGGRLALADGGAARLAPCSTVSGAPLVVAVEASARGGDVPLVTSAVATEPVAVLEALPDAVEERRTVRLAGGRVTAQVELRLGKVVLEREEVEPTPAERAEPLRREVSRAGVAAFVDPATLATLRGRLEVLAGLGLPVVDLSDARLLEHLLAACEGARTLADLRGRDVLAEVRATFPPELGAALARDTPTHLVLPSGRRAPIHYAPGADPYVAAWMQDLFGLTQTPALAGGRVPLVLHLLAPNRRPVQVTRDLAGFWQRHYPALRRQLSRRYPKHAWPEDPTTATPPRPRRRR